jgi:hypothetical protein
VLASSLPTTQRIKDTRTASKLGLLFPEPPTVAI